MKTADREIRLEELYSDFALRLAESARRLGLHYDKAAIDNFLSHQLIDNFLSHQLCVAGSGVYLLGLPVVTQGNSEDFYVD